jgi:hypothetical protein
MLAEIGDKEWRGVLQPLVARAVASRRLRARLAGGALHSSATSGSGRPRGMRRQVIVIAGGYEPNVADLRRLGFRLSPLSPQRPMPSTEPREVSIARFPQAHSPSSDRDVVAG